MQSDLTKIQGVGPSTAEIFRNNGINSIEDLASASIADVMTVPGFREARASQVIASAKMFLAEVEADQPVKNKSKKKVKKKKKSIKGKKNKKISKKDTQKQQKKNAKKGKKKKGKKTEK